MTSELKGKIGLAFKREGLVLQGKEVMDFVVEQLKAHADDASFLVGLLRSIDRQALRQNFVDVAAARKAVELVTMDVGAAVERESFKVIGGMQCPRLRYHEGRKTFVPVEGAAKTLYGTADDQADTFRHRFTMIRQRLLRHDLFSQHKLTTVESLLGQTGRKVVFGMLTRDSHGELILEDLNNCVKIDLSHAKVDRAFYTDHSMVLADGELVHGKFHVHVLTMPPVEESATTLNTFPNVEMHGGAVDPALRREIAAYQEAAEHVMLVVLSEVWLDRPSTMAKLEVLFEGFKDIVPTAFIFTGDYTSRPFAMTEEDIVKLQQAFQGLARLIGRFKSLANGSHWIFSRGPSDAGGPLVFPQFALPDFFVSALRQRLPKVTFTTNPFRMRWCNVRMTVFRENMLSKMRRHALFPTPRDDADGGEAPHTLLVRTLMEQSHLCPLPQAIAPVYWNYDHAMHLYPIPDLLVLCDSTERYVVREDGYVACNPGSFSTDYSFLIIRPATLEVEESSIPAGTLEEAKELLRQAEEREEQQLQQQEEQEQEQDQQQQQLGDAGQEEEEALRDPRVDEVDEQDSDGAENFEVARTLAEEEEEEEEEEEGEGEEDAAAGEPDGDAVDPTQLV